jgi:D-apionolactonase
MPYQLLFAGPVQVELAPEGDLRRIRVGGAEVLCRIYFALRDTNWGTIPGRLGNHKVEQSSGGFRVNYDSVHQDGPIDFRWHASIEGRADGAVTFEMNGKAHSTFRRNRLGFCVHHPLEGCLGRPCWLERPDGSVAEERFPNFIAPHQPFLDIRAMRYEVLPGLIAEVRFSGDIFETEDQRNWSDANFKTYSTPLRLPFPVEVRAGDEIRQSVTIRFIGSLPARREAAQTPVTISTLPGAARLPMPSIGLSLALSRPPAAQEIETLRRLNLGHVRVELGANADEGLLETAKNLGVPVEAAITFPTQAENLRDAAPFVARWLVFGANEPATSAATIDAARRVFGPGAKLVAGTRAFFAEVNRNRPVGMAIDGVCFPATPQVHAFDEQSIMANVVGQGEEVRSARNFLPGVPVAVSPVTLRPTISLDPAGAGAPPPPDPRQKTAFCAAWTVGSLKHLCQTGAASITYFETHGDGGVLDGIRKFPVYDVFEAIARFAGGEVIPCKSSDGSRADALLLSNGASRRMLIANMTDSEQSVNVDAGGGKEIKLAPYGLSIVDWQA